MHGTFTEDKESEKKCMTVKRRESPKQMDLSVRRWCVDPMLAKWIAKMLGLACIPDWRQCRKENQLDFPQKGQRVRHVEISR